MSVKTKIRTISWSVLGLCCVLLLVAAMKAKDDKACSNIEVSIDGGARNMFVKQVDIIAVLNKYNIRSGETLNDINLRKVEDQLEKNAWIKDAELFFDNNQVLHVKIAEREPVARVFTISGNSFYIDSTGLRLPVNENATARVIVFTSFPSDKNILSKPDSMVLSDIKTLTQYITADSFINAQTAQIDITPQRTYEIMPVVGDQVIRIGNADSLNEKFAKLIAFYKQVFSKEGFEKYSVIDVQYEGQVVAIRRGESYTGSDTAKAIKQFANADTKLSKVLSDTSYSAPMAKPVNVNAAGPPQKVAEKKTTVKKANDTVNKNVKDNKSIAQEKKPKAVMKKKG